MGGEEDNWVETFVGGADADSEGAGGQRKFSSTEAHFGDVWCEDVGGRGVVAVGDAQMGCRGHERDVGKLRVVV